jgi:hypothetical protein
VPLQVLQVAVRADAEPAHPFDLVAVWLAALGWVADSRWRRLPSGPHQTALMEWLESLELRVVALSLAQPADFAPDSPGMHACLCVPAALHSNAHCCSAATATLPGSAQLTNSTAAWEPWYPSAGRRGQPEPPADHDSPAHPGPGTQHISSRLCHSPSAIGKQPPW